ncbi:MAG: GrpB family protein [Defluviitaleaceae bacterium]|nr:GrpB family protein [Defluviitaleaceae bacterium]MCL2276112.1 GrpB family protein [Defluviitaleaceae bacterium]
MKKQLSEMTLEELWELFPIILKEHNTNYKDWYVIEEKSILNHINPADITRINHIGSSAVAGLLSKPTIDILLEIDGNCSITQLIDHLNTLGWGLMRREDDPPKLTFNKGYTPDGFAPKVYHLHVRYTGDWDELYFRDYLIAHPLIADEYGKLKLQLLKKYEHDRDAYTAAKSEFILNHTKAAKEEFRNKYKPSTFSYGN